MSEYNDMLLWKLLFLEIALYNPILLNACTKSGSLRFSQFSGC